jgi:cell division protein FtsL
MPQQSPLPKPSAKPATSPRTRRFWLKRWLILGVLAASAASVVFFVNNVLRVGKLTEDIARLHKERERLVQQNELVRTEIIRLQSPERITTLARKKLGMVSASAAPHKIPAMP